MDAEFRYTYRQMTIIYAVAYDTMLNVTLRLVSTSAM